MGNADKDKMNAIIALVLLDAGITLADNEIAQKIVNATEVVNALMQAGAFNAQTKAPAPRIARNS